MIIKTKWLILNTIMVLICCSSCSKEAGEGGTSTITGKVYAKYYNKTLTSYIGESYAPNKYVYIIYGDNQGYGDKQRTNYGGVFEFKYLRKGRYTIYTFSLDTTFTNPAGQFGVVEQVNITDDDQTVTTKDLVIVDTP
jgi:hypothetical protein